MPYPLLLHGDYATEPLHYESLGSWIVPWEFSSLNAEYLALRASVGLINYSSQALIQIQGKDRTAFLHNLLSQDIKQLTPNRFTESALLTPNGKIVAVFMVLCEPDALWLMVDAAQADILEKTLNKHLFQEAVTITNHERSHAVFALEGPKAEVLLKEFISATTFPNLPLSHCKITVNGISLWVVRHSLIGSTQGVLLIVPIEEAKSIWQALAARGKPFGLELSGWKALNTARIESGIPWFGTDMDEDNLLPETGLQTTHASENKGCYLGQEVIARLGTYGSLSKRLMALRIEGMEVPVAGALITAGGEAAGTLTSACFSPVLQQVIGLGFLKRGFYEPNQAVQIQGKDQPIRAVTAEIPLVNPASSAQTPVSA